MNLSYKINIDIILYTNKKINYIFLDFPVKERFFVSGGRKNRRREYIIRINGIYSTETGFWERFLSVFSITVILKAFLDMLPLLSFAFTII